MKSHWYWFAAPLVPIAIAIAVVARPVSAQRSDAPPVGGPLGCYYSVTRGYGLDQASAKQLCIGATGTATAKCYADASRSGLLTQTQIIELCTGATTEDPQRCVVQLRATTGFVAADIIKYCAAMHWPLVYPPEGGSPECIAAVEGQGLSDQQAAQTCRGSPSTAPAECVRRGHQISGMADEDLVQLCATVIPWPVYAATPSGSSY